MTRQYDYLIQAAAKKHLPFMDWRLFRSLLVIESNLNPLAVSPVGAKGIGQFMPATWDQWAPRAGHAGADVTDPAANIDTSAQYLAYLYGQWTSPRPDIDRICLTMASYNAGLGNIIKAQQAAKMQNGYLTIMTGLPAVTGNHAKETQAYAPKILREWVKEVAGG